MTINLPRAQFERYRDLAEEAGVTITQFVQQGLWLREKVGTGEFDVSDAEGRKVTFWLSNI